ncbi:MAG: hypothetical protein DRP51_09615, partial [Candidatus Zixiibacteriota bacterium]
MPILAFHNCSSGLFSGLNNYTPGRFEYLLNIITDNHYKIIGLSDYIDSNQKDNHVALTFDDGYEDQLDKAIPELDARGMKGTFFLCGNKWVEKRRTDWATAA